MAHMYCNDCFHALLYGGFCVRVTKTDALSAFWHSYLAMMMRKKIGHSIVIFEACIEAIDKRNKAERQWGMSRQSYCTGKFWFISKHLNYRLNSILYTNLPRIDSNNQMLCD